MIDNVEILTVNYNTPDLVEQLLKSRDACGYSDIMTIVVDGSDDLKLAAETKNVCVKFKNVTLAEVGENIHHGPGLVFGITQLATKKYIMAMDTDSVFNRPGAIEHLLNKMNPNIYMVGGICYVNIRGIADLENGSVKTSAHPIAYLHPSRCLINKIHFNRYMKPVKHGAPFIETMADIHAKQEEEVLVNVLDLNEWISTSGRGTVGRFGYNLYKNEPKILR